MKVEIDLQEIEGFEYTSEYRTPKVGEYILIAGSVITAQGHTYEYPILKKIEPEYKTTSACYTLDAGIGGYQVEFVEIKALEDLLGVLDTTIITNCTDKQIAIIAKLQELVKGGDS